MEVYYITMQERDQNEAQARVDLMAALPVLRVDSTEALGLLAGELKAKHHMSVADAWIAALAQARNATLVHKDPDFQQVESSTKSDHCHEICDAQATPLRPSRSPAACHSTRA